MDFFAEYFLNEMLNFRFTNELETMVLLSELPFARIYLESEEAVYLQNRESAANLISKSESLRVQGNKLFKESPSKNALSAALLYTKAIFAAPMGSEALAFAHANRSAALQQFGYYRAAYDDCLCALEQGYPKHLRHKIITRQAYCALSLNDANLLERHLQDLKDMKLNKNFANDVQKLQKGLSELTLMDGISKSSKEKRIALYRDKVEIIKSPTKGRCMIATSPIKVNELIFSECATTFIPAVDSKICQKCAITELIPFPCYRCSGKVVYCSVKCREEHAIIHEYECMGYQIGLFPVFEDGHFGLRVLLDGIQQIVPFLRFKNTAKEIWYELTDKDSVLLKNVQLEYVQVLRRITHTSKEPPSEVRSIAEMSNLMMTYLKMFTNFFENFKDTSATRSEWELVIGSLLMLHIGQNKVYVISSEYLSRKTSDFGFDLLDEKLWDKALHVRQGYLHCKFQDVKLAITANYSFLGLMNHSCESMIQLKLTGRYVSCFAIKEINPREEISLNYFPVDKKIPKHFHFECKCSKCTSNNYDRYRCEYSQCRCIFRLKKSNLKLWEVSDCVGMIRCTECNNLQNNLWVCICKIEIHLNSVENIHSRKELFSIFKGLDSWLLDIHLLKISISLRILHRCLEAYNNNCRLTTNDFVALKNILSYLLQAAKQIKKDRLLNVVVVSYFWDIIAVSKDKCNPTIIKETLELIEIAPDAVKEIMMNYYNDFIRID